MVEFEGGYGPLCLFLRIPFRKLQRADMACNVDTRLCLRDRLSKVIVLGGQCQLQYVSIFVDLGVRLPAYLF